MAAAPRGDPVDLRYEADEAPPWAATFGIAGRFLAVLLVSVMLGPVLVARVTGQSDAVMSRMVVATLVVCGLIPIFLMVPLGRSRVANLYFSTPDTISLPFCILALAAGGPATLAVLVAAMGLCQMLVGAHLSRLRRLITPVVSGTLVVLAPISLIPVLWEGRSDRSDALFPAASLVCMIVTAVVMVSIHVLAPRSRKHWAAPLGVLVGYVLAGIFRLYDLAPVREAAWIEFPAGHLRKGVTVWIGGESPFNATFWSLLPSFLILGFIVVLRTRSVSSHTQSASHREPRADNYREIGRANWRLGLGSLASGLAGAVPLNASRNVPTLIRRTRCASRRIGVALSVYMLVLAAIPKVRALVVAIPRSVILIYLLFIMAPILLRSVRGMRIGEGANRMARVRNALVFGVPVMVALLIESGWPSIGGDGFWAHATEHGLTPGLFLLVILAVLNNTFGARRRAIEVDLEPGSVARVRRFVNALAGDNSWGAATRRRLEAVAEEALLVLLQADEEPPEQASRRVRVSAAAHGTVVELEFATAPRESANIEERIALLDEPTVETPPSEIERDVPLRLLRHHAKSVSHRQYRETEIITAVVAVAAG